jgi:peptidoglycan/LPS O-acetylase OafA/YrhL
MILSSPLTAAQRSYLDLLRAVAALLVVVGHSGQHFLQGSFVASGQPQGFGVMLFFLISGFLISTSAFQRIVDPNYRLADFAIDRFARIYTCYLPALILLPALDSIVLSSPNYQWGADFNWRSWIGNLFMLQDFPIFEALRRIGVQRDWFVSSFGSARQFWTICIEWWIYMTFGAALFLVLRPGARRWFALPMLALFAVEPFYYFVGGVDNCLTLLWLLGMMASLLALRLPGGLAARRLDGSALWLRRAAFAAAAFGVLCMIARVFAHDYPGVNELQFGLFASLFVFGLLFACGTTRQAPPRVAARVIGFLAGYSYSLYLTHFTIMELLAIWYPDRQHDQLFFWGSIVLTNLFAIAFYALFERHHKRIARWLKMAAYAERPLTVTGRA